MHSHFVFSLATMKKRKDWQQIVFAFDEIVALGYRESVNLAQIRSDAFEVASFEGARSFGQTTLLPKLSARIQSCDFKMGFVSLVPKAEFLVK